METIEEVERENARLKAALEETDVLIEQQRKELLEIVETARELEKVEKQRSELKEKLSRMKTKALAGTRRSCRLPKPMANEESGQRLRLAGEATLDCFNKIEEAFRRFLESYVRGMQEEEEEEIMELEPDREEVTEIDQDREEEEIMELEPDREEVTEIDQDREEEEITELEPDREEVEGIDQDREEVVELDVELEDEEYEEEEDYVANRGLYRILPALQLIVDVNEIVQAAVDSGVAAEESELTEKRQGMAVICLVRQRELGRRVLLGQLRDKC